jgi:adenylate kinase family enzyme
MKRILVMGPPGSGKSTLAQRLGTQLNLPVFHLDQLFWRPGWVESSRDEFQAGIEKIVARPTWIIEGNYSATIGSRLVAADTLIYLDSPTWKCLYRVIKRIASSYGKVRPDMAEGCPEQFHFGFLGFVWMWNRKNRVRHLRMVETFDGQTFVLRGRDQLVHI